MKNSENKACIEELARLKRNMRYYKIGASVLAGLGILVLGYLAYQPISPDASKQREYRAQLTSQVAQIADANRDGILQIGETNKLARELDYKGVLYEATPYELAVYDGPDVKVLRITSSSGPWGTYLGISDSESSAFRVFLPQKGVEKYIGEHAGKR